MNASEAMKRLYLLHGEMMQGMIESQERAAMVLLGPAIDALEKELNGREPGDMMENDSFAFLVEFMAGEVKAPSAMKMHKMEYHFDRTTNESRMFVDGKEIDESEVDDCGFRIGGRYE